MRTHHINHDYVDLKIDGQHVEEQRGDQHTEPVPAYFELHAVYVKGVEITYLLSEEKIKELETIISES